MSSKDLIVYKRPPKSSQFKKGKSGNPKGRPRGVGNIADSAKAQLDSQIAVHENGKALHVSRRDAMLMQLSKKSLEGDLKAMQLITQYAGPAEEKELQRLASQEQRKLKKEDEELMVRLFGKFRAYKDEENSDD